MRWALIIVGVILLALGIWVVAGNASYQKTDTAAKVGPVAVQTTHDQAVPQWAGIAGIVIGGVLVLAGVVTKR